MIHRPTGIGARRNVAEPTADNLGDCRCRKLQRRGWLIAGVRASSLKCAEQAALDREGTRRHTGLHDDEAPSGLEHTVSLVHRAGGC